ncbi:hypothetical protein AO284_23290 [Pseudomonas sp. NZIPFR-PS2]|nr:hypothetical protein AO284_23290 [Pseudomonas sp. NZIPFR-PS2]
MGGEDVLFLDVLALAGMRQSAANFAAYLLQGGVQVLQLFVGRVVADVCRQFDAGQAEQRPADQARRSTHTLQHAGFGMRSAWGGNDRDVVFFLDDG